MVLILQYARELIDSQQPIRKDCGPHGFGKMLQAPEPPHFMVINFSFLAIFLYMILLQLYNVICRSIWLLNLFQTPNIFKP